MAVQKIHIDDFISLAKDNLVLDVRSPAEYLHAHFKSGYSLPLFSDEERKVVGTTYKQKSREAAIKTGLDYFGPKMKRMVEEVEQLLYNRNNDANGNQNSKTVLVYCWRGGMRSAGVAWLLDLYGFKVYTLVGGYKSFRRWVLQELSKSWKMKILGGYTGSGKTKILQQLKQKGEPVVDLEQLAQHKGSAFGAIGQPNQPSQEMFENLLALQLNDVVNGKSSQENSISNHPIWLEDESQRIGTINLPHHFWNNMREQPVFFLDIPFEKRLSYIVNEYGKLNRSDLAGSITRIQKRLGGLETKTALGSLVENDIHSCFAILLKYYDKLYTKALKNRPSSNQLLNTIPCEAVDEIENTKKLIAIKQPA